MALHLNSDLEEKAKFDRLSSDWWNPKGPLSSLHDINDIRLQWIEAWQPDLKGKNLLDVGCGGGILSETLAKKGANVTGIDISEEALMVAQQHALSENIQIAYQLSSAEQLCASQMTFDIVVCMELLEHVPDPSSTVEACANLVKPGGLVFFSTVNRTWQAYSLVILAAENVLRLIPKGTHQYDRFIKPSELEMACRSAGLTVRDITGFSYSPFNSPKAKLTSNVKVNYMMIAQRNES